MNCSCSATSIDGDGYFSTRRRRAAKPTICPECKKEIVKGELYIFSTLFLEGRIHNSKMCLECEALVDQFFSDGYYVGRIWEDLEGYLDAAWSEDLPSNCISKLPPAVKAKVCDMLQFYQDQC